MIDAMIMVNDMIRMQKATSPTTRRMIASAINPRKRAMRPCIMTSPHCRVPEIRPEKEVDLVHMKTYFDKCIKDFLEAITGFLNISYQLICWLRTYN
jgi:hypothetical protein